MSKRIRFNQSEDRPSQFKADVKEFIETLTELHDVTLFITGNTKTINSELLRQFNEEYYSINPGWQQYLFRRIHNKWEKLHWITLSQLKTC
jgi:hypothetical protein